MYIEDNMCIELQEATTIPRTVVGTEKSEQLSHYKEQFGKNLKLPLHARGSANKLRKRKL
jgi:hypothetical protein